MFNSFWNVAPKTYSKAQRKACQKNEDHNGDQYPEIELPRHCDERSNRQTLDFRGAIKILDDEDDLFVINETFRSGHSALPLRTKQGSNGDIASANAPFSSFDDFNQDDDQRMAFNSTPRSGSAIGAGEEIDDLSTIRSEEFDLQSDDASDLERGTSPTFSNSSDKENEAACRRKTSDDEEIEDVTPVEMKNECPRAKCRKGTPHPVAKLPPVTRQGRLFEPLKYKRNETTKGQASQKQRGGLSSFPKYGDIAMKATNWKQNLENEEKWETKFKNNDEKRSDDEISKYPDEVNVQFESDKISVSGASGANRRNAVGFQELLKPKPKLKSSLAIKVASCVDDDPKNMEECLVVKMLETNLEKPGCCHDLSPDDKSDTLIGNRKIDEIAPTRGRIAKNTRIEDSARSPDNEVATDFTPFRPPRSKRAKIRKKKENFGFRKKKANKMGGRCRKTSQKNLVSRKELDFVKISELLGVLKTNNEDDDDIRNRADHDNDGEGFRSQRDLEVPARRAPIPRANKQLTSTVIHRQSDGGFASETLKSSVRLQSMGLSSIRYEAGSSLMEKHPTTREVESGELMEYASPGDRSVGCEDSKIFQGENVKSKEESRAGDAAAESDLPASKDLGKIKNDSIEQCWLTQDIDFDWGSCYLEVYKYQTYDPNFHYPQDDLELA